MKYDWDLSKIYKNEKDFNNALNECEKQLSELVKFKGKIMKSSEMLYKFLSKSEELNRKAEKLYIYAYLNYYSDTRSSKYKTLTLKIDAFLEKLNVELSFASPELLQSDYKKVLEYIKENDKLKLYAFDLESTFRYKPHVLSESDEATLSNATNAMGMCHDAYSALNNADVKFGFIKDENGKDVELTHSNYSVFIKSNKRNVRKNAFLEMYKFYKNHINTISNLYLGNIKENFFISNMRKFNTPIEKSLFADKIEVSLYDNLIKSVNKNLSLLHKYYIVKKKLLRLDEMHVYDVYVNPVKEKRESIPYDEALEIIYKALSPLGESYVNDLKSNINEWVSVYAKEGKRSGAYSWGCYDTMPYLSLNYEGDYNSVSTLIHEIGHSMHSFYSNKTQPYTYATYPIFLAEIASTVNEILLNRYMLKTVSKKEKKKYILEFLEIVRANVYRQTMFAEFERDIYDKYKSGITLTPDEINSTYMNLNKKYFGDNVILDEEIKYEWARIPHFYTPFYVYKYATGFMIALVIVEKLESDYTFKDKYIKFLSSGGCNYPLEILKSVGIKLDDNAFDGAFKIYKEYLDLLGEE